MICTMRCKSNFGINTATFVIAILVATLVATLVAAAAKTSNAFLKRVVGSAGSYAVNSRGFRETPRIYCTPTINIIVAVATTPAVVMICTFYNLNMRMLRMLRMLRWNVGKPYFDWSRKAGAPILPVVAGAAGAADEAR